MAEQLLPIVPPISGVNGAYLPGAKVYFYKAGTFTLAEIYETPELDSPRATNPLIADANGRIPQPFFQGAYEVRAEIFNADDVKQFEVNPCPRAAVSSTDATAIVHTPTAENTATNVQAAIAQVDARISDLGKQGTIGKSLFTANTASTARALLSTPTFPNGRGPDYAIGTLLFAQYKNFDPVTLLPRDLITLNNEGVELVPASLDFGSDVGFAAEKATIGTWVCCGSCTPSNVSVFIRVS